MEKKIKNDERWRERVQKFERIRVGDILANGRNAKKHPKKQTDAVAQSLDSIGKAAALMAYYSERNGGKLTLWDGHARQGLNQSEIWWVAVTDLTDAEADQMLLTYDPLAAMAEWDKELLAQLMDANDALSGELAAMAADIWAEVVAPAEDEIGEEKIKEKKETLPKLRTFRALICISFFAF